MFRRLIIFYILFNFLFLLSANEPDSEAGELWLSSYDLYEKAESFYEKEDLASSLVYYEKASDKFKELNKKYPSWNSELVLYRIKYCDERSIFIRNRLVLTKKNATEDELIKENIQMHTSLAIYKEELSSQQTKLKEALKKIENDKKLMNQDSAAADKLRDVLKEKLELEKKYEFLARQSGGAKDAYDSQLVDNLRSTLENQRMEIESLRNEKTKITQDILALNKNFAESSKARLDLEFRLKSATEKLKSYEEEKQTAEKKVNAISYELKTTNADLSRAREKSDRLESLLYEMKKTGSAPTDKSDQSKIEQENETLKNQISSFHSEIERLSKVRDAYNMQLKEAQDAYQKSTGVISSLSEQYQYLKTETDTLRKEISKKNEAELAANAKINEMSARLSESRESYALLSQNYKKLENDYSVLPELQSRNQSLEEHKADLENLLRNYQQDINRLKKEKDLLNASKVELESEKTRLLNEHIKLKSTGSQKYDEKEAELETVNQKLKELEREKNAQDQRIRKLMDESLNKEKQINELNKKNLDIEAEAIQAARTINELDRKYMNSSQELTKLSQQLNMSNIRLQEYETSRRDLNELLKKAQQEKEEAGKLAEQRHMELKDSFNKIMERDQAIQREKEVATEKEELLKQAVKQIDSYKQISNESKNENQELLKQLKEMAAELRDALNEKGSIDSQFQGLLDRSTALESEKEGLQNKYDELLESSKKAAEERSKIEYDKEQLLKEIARLNENMSGFNSLTREDMLKKEDTMKKIDDLNASLGSLQSRYDELAKENEKIRGDLELSAAKIAAFDGEKKQYLDRIKELIKSLEEAQKTAQVSDSMRSLAQEQFISMNSRVNELEKVRNEQNKMIDDLNKKLNETANNNSTEKDNSDLSELNARMEEFKNDEASYQAQLASASKKISDYENRHDQIEKDLAAERRERSKLESEFQNANAQISSMNEKLLDQRMRNEELLKRMAELEEGLKESDNEKKKIEENSMKAAEDYDSFSKSYEERISELNKQIESLVKERSSISAGAADNMKLTAELDNAKETIDKIQTEQESNIKKIEELLAELDNQKKNSSEGELVNARLSSDINSLKEQLADFEAEKRSVQSQTNELITTLSLRDKQIKTLEENAVLSQGMLQTANKEKEDISRKYEEQSAELASAINDVEVLKEDLERISKDIDIINASLVQSEKESALKDLKIAELIASMDEIKAKLEKAEREKADAENKLDMKNIELQAVNENLSAMMKNTVNNSLQVENLQKQLLKTKELFVIKDKEISILTDKVKSAENDIERFKKEKELYDKKIDDINKELAQALTRTDEIRIEKETLQKQNETITSLFNALEADYISKEKELSALNESMKSAHGVMSSISSFKLNLKALSSSAQKEISRLETQYNEQIAQNKIQLAELESIKLERAELEKTNEKLFADIGKYRAELQENAEKTQSLNASMSFLVSNLESAKNQAEAFQKERDKLTAVVSALQNELESSRSFNVKLKDELAKAQQNVDIIAEAKVTDKLSALQSSYNELAQKNADLDNRTIEVTKNLRATTAQLKKTQLREKNLEDINADLQKKLIDANSQKLNFERSFLEKERFAVELSSELEKLKFELVGITSQSDAVAKEAEEKDNIIKELKENNLSMRSRIVSLNALIKVIEEQNSEPQSTTAPVSELKTKDESTVSEKQYIVSFSDVSGKGTTAYSDQDIKILNDRIKILNSREAKLNREIASLNKKIHILRFNSSKSNRLSSYDKERVIKLVRSSRVYTEKRRFREAFKYLSMAADIAVTSYQIQKNAGMLAMRIGDYDKAFKYLNNAVVSSDNDDSSLFIAKALTYIYRGEYPKSIIEFHKAAESETNTELAGKIDILTLNLIAENKKASESGDSLEKYIFSEEFISAIVQILCLYNPPMSFDADKLTSYRDSKF